MNFALTRFAPFGRANGAPGDRQSRLALRQISLLASVEGAFGAVSGRQNPVARAVFSSD